VSPGIEKADNPWCNGVTELRISVCLLTAHDAVGEHENIDVGREGAEDEGSASDDASRYADCSTAELVGQRTHDGTCKRRVNTAH